MHNVTLPSQIIQSSINKDSSWIECRPMFAVTRGASLKKYRSIY